MAETSSQQTPTQTQSVSDSDSLQYWCHHCEKRVSIETLENLPDVICFECKNGFVESITPTTPLPSTPPSLTSDQIDEPSLSGHFLQVLRLIAQAAREGDEPPPPPPEHADPSGDDFLRIELDGWDNDDDDDDDANEVDVRNEGGEDRSDDENENHEESDEEELSRRRREVIRLRLREFASRAANRRNRVLDWAEILMGLEDHSIELRLQVPDGDDYVGNPEDYVDAAGYEALLQNLAEGESSGRRGAPPAAKSAVSVLPTIEIKSEKECLVCAICKDLVNVGDIAKKMPCGHGYHGDCILPWLGARNSCPVCRYELPTDDPEYEEERKKRLAANADGGSSSTGEYIPGFD
ncbi:E3 ubiquitin-protein ligase CIP8 [Cornus florida]|uniref:E3 ubiquitin-protein ligase CIP8 n=1 Tax=Cornus florida TaxID=4283 RepID=UPI0028A2163C|nr:E3 ubiquitin-protein ligase CIP8 [Cornus florida]